MVDYTVHDFNFALVDIGGITLLLFRVNVDEDDRPVVEEVAILELWCLVGRDHFALVEDLFEMKRIAG